MSLTSNKIRMVKGDSRTLLVTIEDIDGNAIDLTGYSIIFSVKLIQRDTAYIFQKKNTVAGGGDDQILLLDQITEKGKFRVFIKPDDTSPLRNQGNNYVYDIQIQLGTDEVKTPVISELILNEDVTI